MPKTSQLSFHFVVMFIFRFDFVCFSSSFPLLWIFVGGNLLLFAEAFVAVNVSESLSICVCVFYSSSLLMSTCAYQFRCVKGIYCTVHTFGGRHDDGSAVETFNVTFIEKVQYTLNESVSLNTNYHHRAHTALITVLV